MFCRHRESKSIHVTSFITQLHKQLLLSSYIVSHLVLSFLSLLSRTANESTVIVIWSITSFDRRKISNYSNLLLQFFDHTIGDIKTRVVDHFHLFLGILIDNRCNKILFFARCLTIFRSKLKNIIPLKFMRLEWQRTQIFTWIYTTSLSLRQKLFWKFTLFTAMMANAIILKSLNIQPW